MKPAIIVRFLAFSVGLCSITAGQVYARDVYLLQGFTTGASFNRQTTVWSTDTLFYNKGPADEHVTLLGISNGVDPNGRVGQSITVSPGRTASLQQEVRWVPAIPFVMLHLDVPDNVTASDLLYIGSRNDDFLGSPNTLFRRYGIVRLPLFNALVPANEPQVHLESDIGGIEAHVNVAIFNASDITATARIETRAHCDDGVISQRTVTVPSNSVVQFGPFQAETTRCVGVEQTKSIYTVVTVDQPSLTVVSSLANNDSPTTSITINGI